MACRHAAAGPRGSLPAGTGLSLAGTRKSSSGSHNMQGTCRAALRRCHAAQPPARPPGQALPAWPAGLPSRVLLTPRTARQYIQPEAHALWATCAHLVDLEALAQVDGQPGGELGLGQGGGGGSLIKCLAGGVSEGLAAHLLGASGGLHRLGLCHAEGCGGGGHENRQGGKRARAVEPAHPTSASRWM